ncbi:MAG: HAD-IIIA family hydrolase, partial [Bacteroidetes bacterium]|nr:HAD-IIIA family hydrolase [Bacteroidota bacterium]
VPYNSNPDTVYLIPNSATAIRLLGEAGIVVVITTNQSGIGRGYYTEKEFQAVNRRMIELLDEEGARLDAVFHCPHLPAELLPPGREPCKCRKPELGMVERACEELGVDPGRSFFFGDRLSDVEMAVRAGGRAFLVRTGYGMNEVGIVQRMEGVTIVDDLFTGVSEILSAAEKDK